MRLPIVICVVVITCLSMVVTPAWSESSSTDTQQGTPSGVGMQVASLAATILYFPFKGAFAIGGGIVGGLAYIFSGGSEKTAKNIWVPSMYGTYILTPEHLSGERPVRFLGVASETEGAPAASSPMSYPTP